MYGSMQDEVTSVMFGALPIDQWAVDSESSSINEPFKGSARHTSLRHRLFANAFHETKNLSARSWSGRVNSGTGVEHEERSASVQSAFV